MKKKPSMPASRTHFEQIPVEVVKKIAEAGVSRDQKNSTDNVILEWVSKNPKPRTGPARSSARKRR